MMAAQEDTTKYSVGFRFNPFDHELIDNYLKPEILKPDEQVPCNFIKHKKVYGPCSNPWCVFDSDDWFRSPGQKLTEKSVYVFAKLSKVSRSNGSNWKNTSKKAGCGTWSGKGKQDQIFDCQGKLIGEKKYLVYEINNVDSLEFDLRKVGQYKMHEYSLSGDNAGLNSAGAYATVLCRITHDSSKECTINLKSGSGTKAAGKVSTEVAEENNNVEGTSIATTENLTVEGTSIVTTETVLGSGVVGPVGECSQFNNDALELGDSGVGPVGECSVGECSVGECSDAVQFNNDALELGDFCGGLGFDDLGVDFIFDDPVDFYWDDQSNYDVNWFMESPDSDQQEEPYQDNTSSQLKRKSESDKDLFHSKKMCLDNPN